MCFLLLTPHILSFPVVLVNICIVMALKSFSGLNCLSEVCTWWLPRLRHIPAWRHHPLVLPQGKGTTVHPATPHPGALLLRSHKSPRIISIQSDPSHGNYVWGSGSTAPKSTPCSIKQTGAASQMLIWIPHPSLKPYNAFLQPLSQNSLNSKALQVLTNAKRSSLWLT